MEYVRSSVDNNINNNQSCNRLLSVGAYKRKYQQQKSTFWKRKSSAICNNRCVVNNANNDTNRNVISLGTLIQSNSLNCVRLRTLSTIISTRMSSTVWERTLGAIYTKSKLRRGRRDTWECIVNLTTISTTTQHNTMLCFLLSHLFPLP